MLALWLCLISILSCVIRTQAKQPSPARTVRADSDDNDSSGILPLVLSEHLLRQQTQRQHLGSPLNGAQSFIGKVSFDRPEVTTDEAMISEQWRILGPFQVGTREIAWGADPLELYGGFHNLAYNENATFKSSLGHNGTVSWSSQKANVKSSDTITEAALSVKYSGVDWKLLQATYGWPALQWQGWARGQIVISGDEPLSFALHVDQIIQYWVDDEHFFGGDFYGYHRAPVTLKLQPGAHTIDVRLFRDVRSQGGVGEPNIDFKVTLERLYGLLSLVSGQVLFPDSVNGYAGPLASQYGSVAVRNDADEDLFIVGIDGMHDVCKLELLADKPLRLVPGQTRPIGFRIACVSFKFPFLDIQFLFKKENSNTEIGFSAGGPVNIIQGLEAPHKITFVHPGGMVSYAILRPPNVSTGNSASNTSKRKCVEKQYAPIIIFLHGAGVEADSEMAKHSLDSLSDVCAWTLFPTGVTSWCGDDWHQWGFADVEAAVDAIAAWVKDVDWQGPLPDTSRWIVVGHSNGGQGAWYTLTHRPDKVVAAAALSGYSSIQNYVPYSLWRTAEPAREVVVQQALLSYRHELLLENSKGIPIYQQHGSADDNVPVFHSSLLGQRIQQAGWESSYFEVPRGAHWWDGILATEPFERFVRDQVDLASDSGPKTLMTPPKLADFSIVVANPGDMGPKHGVQVLQLLTPGRLGRLDFKFTEVPVTCTLTLTNIRSFKIPAPFAQECRIIYTNGQQLNLPTNPATVGEEYILTSNNSIWTIESDLKPTIPTVPDRRPRQQGGLEAILRTKGAFQIVSHNPETQNLALQISRNLAQYFNADTEVSNSSSYSEILESTTGTIISLAIGDSLPEFFYPNFPISHSASALTLRDDQGIDHRFEASGENGLAAIYVRPPQKLNDRLELVVWGVDVASLEVAARLVPMITGTGQPDFVVMDREMLWKGLDGARALGFFVGRWEVSRISFV